MAVDTTSSTLSSVTALGFFGINADDDDDEARSAACRSGTVGSIDAEFILDRSGAFVANELNVEVEL